MNLKAFHKKYLEYLKHEYNPKRAKKEKQYLYSSLKHYGLSVQKRDAFFKSVKTELKALLKKEALDFVKYFWAQPSHEEKSVALSILNLNVNKLTLADMPLIEKLMRESKGWAFLDSLIIPIMPTILNGDSKGYDYLRKWIADNDFWVRRSALLAQLLFFRQNKGGNKDLFFELARSQFDESWITKVYGDQADIMGIKGGEGKRARFFIRKAIGWVLRDMSVKDPKAVIKFLSENKKKMSGLSYREGGRKLSR